MSLKSPLAIVVIGAAAAATYALWPTNSTAQMGEPIVQVLIPESLSADGQQGKTAFLNRCAACHGENAVGQVGVAPPLVHKIYEPSHHGDASFMRAAFVGVQQHHWPFGSMPPVEGVTELEIRSIITYIRELQRANGIS
jgi:mono/diheme cytochrome c family protein